MQAAGLSDQAILDRFAQEMGKDVVAVHPGVVGSLTFYAAAVFGLILVLVVIRRYTRPSLVVAQAASDDGTLDRYHEQIEKEVDKLE
jgi:cytochrome c-type biogenesis protein CcmH/NrfF